MMGQRAPLSLEGSYINVSLRYIASHREQTATNRRRLDNGVDDNRSCMCLLVWTIQLLLRSIGLGTKTLGFPLPRVTFGIVGLCELMSGPKGKHYDDI